MSTEKKTHVNSQDNATNENNVNKFSIDGLENDIKNSLIQASEPNEFEQLIFDHLVKVDADYIEPEPILAVKGKYTDRLTLFSRGNLSLIQGQAKSRKTFALVLLVSWALAENPNLKILWIDTEQGSTHVNRVQRRVYRLMKWSYEAPKEQFKMYGLRSFATQDRANALEFLIKHHNPDLVVLDGIRDLMFDFNDIKESTDVVGLIMKLSEIYDCHITSVLHENKNDRNARGHAGTELNNKAETVLSVIYEDDLTSKITFIRGRDGGFDDIYFEIDQDGVIPKVVTPPEKPIKQDPKKVFFDLVLPRGEMKRSKELIQLLNEKGGIRGTGIKDDAAKAWIADALKKEFIDRTANKFYYSVANNDGKELQDDAIQTEISDSEISDKKVLEIDPPF